MAKVRNECLTRLTNIAHPKLSIVFIHGLGGGPRTTWESVASDSTSSERSLVSRIFGSTPTVYWPQDLLAADIPQAQIWTYGYSVDLTINNTFGPSGCSIEKSAETLAWNLRSVIRADLENSIPLIFVAHDLGGVILKHVMSIYHMDDIPKRTKSILFIGVPQRQNDTVLSVNSRLADLALLSSRSTKRAKLINHYHQQKLLVQMEQSFIDVVERHDITIHSFQEGRPILGIPKFSGKIVNDYESKLDIPLETTHMVHADHKQMTKCSSRTDERYVMYLSAIQQTSNLVVGLGKEKGGSDEEQPAGNTEAPWSQAPPAYQTAIETGTIVDED